MIHIFDLDLTVWETYDKNGYQIWAKQLIFPLIKISEDEISDDVGSKCILKIGIREYLNRIQAKNLSIGYVSVGRHWNLEDKLQPSIHLIQLFDLEKYFNSLKILTYKNMSKHELINEYKNQIIFYQRCFLLVMIFRFLEGRLRVSIHPRFQRDFLDLDLCH